MTDPLGLINPNTAAGVTPVRPPSPAGAAEGPSFRDALMKNLEQVNQLQQDAQVAIEDAVTGKRDDFAAVMTAKQKADLAFQMLLQVRNKMMDAYEEVKQIRV